MVSLFKIKKKSQTNVVATVLLILLTIVAASLIISFTIPFVREQLSASNCINYAEKLEIKQHPTYTCYNSSDDSVNVQIHLGEIEDRDQLEGFQIVVNNEGGSKAYRVTIVSPSPEVKMFNGSTAIVLPGTDEERTYKISGIDKKPETINAFFIIDENQCEIKNTLTFVNECRDLTF